MEGLLAILILIGVLSFGGSAEPKTEMESSVNSSCPANVSGRIKQAERKCGHGRHIRDLSIPRAKKPDRAATIPTECPDD